MISLNVVSIKMVGEQAIDTWTENRPNFQKPTQETRETPIRGRMKVCTIAVALMAIMVLSVVRK